MVTLLRVLNSTPHQSAKKKFEILWKILCVFGSIYVRARESRPTKKAKKKLQSLWKIGQSLG